MTSWKEAVEFCNKHYKNCIQCPIRGACWEDRSKLNRTSEQYEKDIIATLEELKNEERLSRLV